MMKPSPLILRNFHVVRVQSTKNNIVLWFIHKDYVLRHAVWINDFEAEITTQEFTELWNWEQTVVIISEFASRCNCSVLIISVNMTSEFHRRWTEWVRMSINFVGSPPTKFLSYGLCFGVLRSKGKVTCIFLVGSVVRAVLL